MPLEPPALNPTDKAYWAKALQEALQQYHVGLTASQYSIGGRQVTRQTQSQLMNAITYYQRQIKQLEARAGGARCPEALTAVWNHRRG